MQIKLVVLMIVISTILFVITSVILKKGRIPEKYALLWYAMVVLIFLFALFPNLFVKIAKSLGFYPMSSFIIGIFIGMLVLMVMALTVMAAGQKKKTTLLIQELSILKSETEKLKGKE